MEKKSVLIVDDERNIRLTLSRALEEMDLETETAVNGEEALLKLETNKYHLLLLDLKMPGMDGMEVLRRLGVIRPNIRVIIITAHGTIDSAVEAMKLGAVDFIQKPFSPQEIRDLVSRVLNRETIQVESATDYESLIELAKRAITDRFFDTAEGYVRKALAADPSKAEIYNLLGAILEIRGQRMEALKFYRASLDLDPIYKPAWANLDRATSMHPAGDIRLGESERGK